MPTVLVTGASGFLGRHLVRSLRQADRQLQVRAFSRTDFGGENDGRVESYRGDITNLDDIESAMRGVDQIYHLAGVVERCPSDPWRAYRTHVVGTRNLCEAMLKQGSRRCVVVSSSGTIAVSREPTEHTEESGYKQTIVHEWPYYLSKIYQEKQTLWYCQHRALPITVVNPSLLLGPGDIRLSSTNDVRLFLMGQIKTIPTGGLNLVDVRDVAAGLIGAMRSGAVGERYLLAGENLTFREWIVKTARLADVGQPSVQLSEPMARLGAAALRRIYPWAGKRFELDDATVRMSSLFWYCNADKARGEIGFSTRSANETLRDTISYLRSTGAA